MKILIAAVLAAISGPAAAAGNEIPLAEQAFVEHIKTVGKAQIVEQLGEPASAVDVTDEETGEVMGAIWHYHYLNTGENGDYYRTTELDFIGDRVVTVVFSMTEEDALATQQADPASPLQCAPTC